MPILDQIAEQADTLTAWRRHLHAHPEVRFDCHETAAFIAARLQEFGVDALHGGMARTGVVGLIEGRRGTGPTLGLRADMDALPIQEETGLAWASRVPGRMHACGHDGHVTMLLGAAQYLAATRDFSGRVALIFQPAEEWGGGAEAMIAEGLMERFDIASVYALHNAPGLPVGRFETRPGPIMAAVDTMTVHVHGRGGHAANPEDAVDPVAAMVTMIGALQTIVSRNRKGTDALVLSVTQVQAGHADNVIPDSGWFCATIRSYDPAVRAMVEGRCRTLLAGVAQAMGVRVTIDYDRGYPATVNHPAETEFALSVAAEITGQTGLCEPVMGAEDFSYMLARRPGAFVFLGQGAGPSLHQARYDFNDAIGPIGASYFARLAERFLAPS